MLIYRFFIVYLAINKISRTIAGQIYAYISFFYCIFVNYYFSWRKQKKYCRSFS